MPKPNLFIVGSWKAGTSSLYHYLNAHPEVYMSPVKEPHYFVRHSKFRPRLFWLKFSYLNLFKNAGSAKIIGEASTYYFCMPESAHLIHDFNPQAKIIIMLRNPVDAIYAFHAERIFLGRENRDFAAALACQAAHPRHVPNYLALIHCWPQRIQNYWDLFGKERVHIILFDELAHDTDAMFGRLLKFLDIDTGFRPEFKIHNPSKVATSRKFAWFSAHPLVTFAMKMCCISSCAAQKIENFRIKKICVKPRAPMDADLRKKLISVFTPTVNSLSNLLLRDLSHWNR